MVINSISGRVFSDALPDICNFQSLLSNMKIFKLQYLGICLLLVAGISVTNAAVFKSVSGRFFRDYTINQVTHDQVEILHADGCTWLPHEELPPHILREYSRVIAQKKFRYNQRFEAAIREKIEQARYEETSQQAVTMLLEIKKQYPSHPLIKEVDELIAAKGKEVAWEKNFITICSSGSIEEQIFQLQSLRDENPGADKNIVRKINAAIESRKKSLQDSVNRITAAISAASALEDHEQAIAGLKSVLKKYPAYPISEQQSSYLDKVNQLIADREQILAEERQKISDRLTSFVEKNPDIQEQLKKLFMHDDSDTFDRQLGEKIFAETSVLYEESNNAIFSEDRPKAISTLTKYLADFKYALNKEEVERVKDHVIKLHQEKVEKEERIARIRQISLVTNSNGPVVIKKQSNRSNIWRVIVITAAERQKFQRILNLYQTLNESSNALTEANFLVDRMISFNLAKDFKISNSNECSLQNLNTHVFLIVTESYAQNGTLRLNYWSMEYIPGRSSNYWTLK